MPIPLDTSLNLRARTYMGAARDWSSSRALAQLKPFHASGIERTRAAEAVSSKCFVFNHLPVWPGAFTWSQCGKVAPRMAYQPSQYC